jgi:ribonuclease Y
MNVEDYVKRIGEMENIAMSFPGINKAYALSAGREIRVFVDADLVSDLDAEKKAQDIATMIEANCSYPGEVKVIVFREKRIVQYAK